VKFGSDYRTWRAVSRGRTNQNRDGTQILVAEQLEGQVRWVYMGFDKNFENSMEGHQIQMK